MLNVGNFYKKNKNTGENESNNSYFAIFFINLQIFAQLGQSPVFISPVVIII